MLPGLVGTIQATETLKLTLGAGEPLVGRLLLIDALNMRFHTVSVQRDPTCPACGTREITSLIDYDEYCGTSTNTHSTTKDVVDLTPNELAQRLTDQEDFALIDVREPYEWEIGRIPGARLIPLGSLHTAMASMDNTREVVVYCRSGVRSADAVVCSALGRISRLESHRRHSSLSDDVDPSVPVNTRAEASSLPVRGEQRASA